MIPKKFTVLAIFLIVALLVTMIPSCRPVFAAESYMAVMPKVLHSGQTEEISLALFEGDRLVSGDVEVTLLSDGEEILSVEKSIDGKGTISLDIPDIEDGEYEIVVRGTGFEGRATVRVEKSFLTFLETEYPMEYSQSADIEATAYATLALIKHGDAFNASRAAKWLVSQRNAYGGFGSTQDTVMALQALIEYSTGTRADVDLTVTIETSESSIEKRITTENFDVLQIVEVPINDRVEITTRGEGEAIAQVVRRFNLPQAEAGEDIIRIDVDYDTTEVEVNDLVTVSVELEFNPPQPMEAGMIVLDISVPTGFTPIMDSIAAVVDGEDKIKRYEVAGRKVIFYIENMLAGDSLAFSFEVQAMFPVKAKGVTSQAYSYYQPEIRGETLGEEVTVS